jgi:nucleotide-binding universal stress UspA family protein
MYGVLIPVDDDENRARNQAAYVAGLGAGEDIEAAVLRVVPPTRRGEASDETFADADAAVAAAEHLAASGIEADRRTERGGVAGQVVRTASELDSHEIVMGGRKRSGVQTVILGSTTQDVVLSANRPVTLTG